MHFLIYVLKPALVVYAAGHGDIVREMRNKIYNVAPNDLPGRCQPSSEVLCVDRIFAIWVKSVVVKNSQDVTAKVFALLFGLLVPHAWRHGNNHVDYKSGA